MRVLLVSGIFPPDIGGPATHAAEIRAELVARPRRRDAFAHGCTTCRRRRRHHPLSACGRLAAAQRERRWRGSCATPAGSTSSTPPASRRSPLPPGGWLDTPVILKIVADAAWERVAARPHAGQLRSLSGLEVGRPEATSHARSAELVGPPRDRGRRSERASRANNPEMGAPQHRRRRAQRRALPRRQTTPRVRPVRVWISCSSDASLPSNASIFSSRQSPEPSRPASRSWATVPELDRLQSLAARLGVTDRVSFAGVLDHEQVLRRVAAADALVLASSHEGLPHVVLEALVSGTPVVTSPAGGVGEVLTDEVDGLLVRDATPQGFATAFERLARDPALLARLRKGAAETGTEWRFERCADRLEQLMRSTAKPPRAVFVARARMSIPPRADAERKYELHGRHIRTVIVCPATRAGISKPGGATVVGLPPLRTPVLGTALFYSVAPVVALAIAAGRRQTAIVCQSPYEGFGVLALRNLLPPRLRPPVQIELHGDWRTATRLYGSSRRRFVSGAADRIGLWALRRADRVRPVSEVLARLARDSGYRGPLDRFVAFSDYSTFLEHPIAPLPEEAARTVRGRPRALQGPRRAPRRVARSAAIGARRAAHHRRFGEPRTRPE